MTAPNKETKPSRIKIYVIGASIVVVLIIVLLVWKPWSTSLYERYSFSKLMPVPKQAASLQSPLAKGTALYNEGKYAEARKILQQEYMMTPQNPSLSYYFAITLIETGKEYEARTVLINLYNGKSDFKYDAAFYVALSLVRQGDSQQALEWLSKIPQSDARFSKAQSLIKELK